MGRTFIRQDTQIRNSGVSADYDDSLSAGSTLQSGAASLLDDMNAIRSQLKRSIWADSAGNWYDDLQGSPKRGQSALNSDLLDIEEKPILFRSQVVVTGGISVPATQNRVVLSVASSETPSETAAVGSSTAEGAIVAQATSFDTNNQLDLVAGPNGLSPKNLCVVVDQATNDPILSGGRKIWALLHSEIATDGHTFNDTDQQVMLSFVRQNAAGDAFESCPVADIESQDINYSYIRRVYFDGIPETAFLIGAFVDQAGSVDVTLDNAIDNQSGPASQVQDIDWRISDTYTLDFQTSDGGRTLLSIAPNAAGDAISVDVDTLDVNNALDADFLNGAKFDTGGTEIDIGVNAGVIETTGSNDLTVKGAGELWLTDGNKSAGWSLVGLKLTETSTEWDDLETEYGEVSLAAMLIAAKNPGNARGTKVYAVVTSDADANVDVGGVGGGTNLDTQLPDMSTGTFITSYDVYLNGELLRGGVDSNADHDYYPGTSLANGQLRFEFKVKTGDQICVIPYNI
jgi:hypothetical protein